MARIKNVEAFCGVCNGIRKMELAGDVNGQENKRWAKCKKCKQTMVIDMAETIKEAKPSLEGIESGDCSVSNGRSSIAVEFQKSGHKKLIESLTI